MMNWDIQKFFTLFIAAVFLVGCHFFDDPDESFDESDDDCPLNSGYPCACDPGYVNQDGDPGICDDGSDCLFTLKEPDFGFCSKACTVPNDCITLDTELGIGRGICQPIYVLNELYYRCFLMCENISMDLFGNTKTISGKCPWGLECQETEDLYIKACLLPNFYDD